MQVPKNEIKEYIEIILRRKLIFIFSFVITFLIAVAFAFLLPPIYKSTTLILVEGQKVPEAYVKPTVTTSMQERLKTISQQIMSRTRLEKIIDEVGLYRNEKPGVFKILLNKLGFNIATRPPVMDELVDKMRKNIELKVNGKAAFTLSFIGRNPETTMRVANTLASLFIEENLKVREEYAEGTTNFLEDELKIAKAELERQESAVQQFKQRNMGALPSQLDANLRTLDRLQLELQSIRDSIKKSGDQKTILEERLAELQRQRIAGVDSDVTVPLDPLERQLIDLKKEYSRLSATFKDNYPDVMIVKSKIKETEAALKARGNTQKSVKKGSLDNTKSMTALRLGTESGIKAQLKIVNRDIISLKKSEKRLKNQIKEYEKRVEMTPANEQRLTALMRDYSISQKNYQSLLQKRLESKLSSNLEKRQKGEQFRVIDAANLPEKPFKPNRQMIVLMGIVLALGVGFGFAYGLEYLNPVFHKAQDLYDFIDIPVLATISEFSPKTLGEKR